MAVLFSPFGNSQFVNASGAPATGWKIYTYAAGSSTPLATYTTSAGSVAQTNPIVINSLGFPTTGQVWLTSGLSYKLVLTDENDVVKKTEDNITGVTGAASVSQWVASGLTPTYVSATSFTLAGDQTSAFSVNRLLQSTVTAGTTYSRIESSVYGALTTVTVLNLSGTLDSGMSAVSYGLLSSDNQSIPPIDQYVNAQTGTTYTYAKSDKGKLVTHTNASAIAGTLPVASTTGAFWWMDVHNRGAGTLTITPTTSTVDGAATLVLTTGQGARIVSDGTNYYTQRFSIADASITAPKLSGAQTGTAPVFGVRAWVKFNGTGTVAINGSGNVSSITDNGTGDYTVNLTTAMPNADYAVNVSASSAGAAVSAPIGANFRTGAGTLSPPTTTATRFTLCAGGTAYDCDYVFVQIVG